VLAAGGVNVLVVCQRTDPSGAQPSRDDIRKRLFDQRLDLVARGYLRDLRRQAFIDIRL
jgi:peptidyl-prolyl cis-trans isomerase SurA